MNQLDAVKDAICEALDRKPGVLGMGCTSLQLDVRFFDNGQVKNISVRPTIEFAGRRQPPIDQFQFNGTSENKGLTSTV